MPANTPRSLTVTWGSESVLVSSIDHDLPAPGEPSAQGEVVAAGAANPQALLPDGAWRAIARATTAPEGIALQLRPSPGDPGGLLLEENVEGATLRSVVTRVHLSELLPGIQPRTGMEVNEVPDPQVEGLTRDGRPCAVVRYRYKDFGHLKDHVWQTLHGTLSINSYASSILARKVTRSLIAHPVEVTFEDGTPSFHGLVVRDGITRLASAWNVLAGPDADAAKTAAHAVGSLFGGIRPDAGEAGDAGGAGGAGGAAPALDERLAEHRAQWREGIRKEFAHEMGLLEPGLRAAQIAQTFVVPAQIAVGAQHHPGHPLAPQDVFDDAVRSILASVHVDFKQWDAAAQHVEVITRALKRVIQQGDSLVPAEDLQAVYGLAVGRTSPDELPAAFRDDTIPGTPLWRSVYLVHALTRAGLFEQLKDQAKTIKGGRRMGPKGFAELLGPLVDLPWRSHKRAVTKQARNAWNNGGVLTDDVMLDWDPVPTGDFTSLVGPASRGDLNARCTLAVAGGIALIADKLLTRNVGSALGAAKEKGGVPFRSDVNQVVQDLSRQDNELGLWTLALAANAFRGDALPENAVTLRQLIRKDPDVGAVGRAYVHFRVDLAQPDRIARDENGVPEQLYQWDVVAASDEKRARPAKAAAGTGAGAGPGTDPDAPDAPTGTGAAASGRAADGGGGPGAAAVFLAPAGVDGRPASQRAADDRDVLRTSLAAAHDALERLKLLEPEVGAHTPVIPLPGLKELNRILVSLTADIENLRRRTEDLHEEDGAEAEEAEEGEDAEEGLG
ncbi:hypothetical protein ACFV6G_23755 [Streptomyces lavendulae]|uniref:hypothetical protein n=1 Tax=Streptomyces lavendulae TaxID=1914 RepID=UPI003683315A